MTFSLICHSIIMLSIKSQIQALLHVCLIALLTTASNDVEFRNSAHHGTFVRFSSGNSKLSDDGSILHSVQVSSTFECSRKCLKHPECKSLNIERNAAEHGKKDRQCELLSSFSQSEDGLSDAAGWEYYRRSFADLPCSQCPRIVPVTRKRVGGFVLLPTGQEIIPDKDAFKEKVLAGDEVAIIFRNQRDDSSVRRVPDTFFFNSSNGEITFKMPYDVVHDSVKNVLEVHLLSVTTTGVLEQISFELSKSVTTAVMKSTHAQDLKVFILEPSPCNTSLAWLGDSEESDNVSQCLARFASRGAGFSVLVQGDEVDQTRYSVSDSVVVSTSGTSLHTILSPRYTVQWTGDGTSVSAINRELQMVNWDGSGESWTKDEMTSKSRLSSRHVEPPKWYVDDYWEEIYSVDSEGNAVSPNASPNTVHSAVVSGFRMKDGVLVRTASSGNAWQIFHAHTIRCVTSTNTCEAYAISQFQPSNPFHLGETATDITRQGIKVTENEVEITNLKEKPVSVTTLNHAVKWYRELSTVSLLFRYADTDPYHNAVELLQAVMLGLPLTLLRTTSDSTFAHRVEYVSTTASNVFVLRTGLTMVRTGKSRNHGACLYTQGPQYMLTATLDLSNYLAPSAVLDFSSWSHDLKKVCHKRDRLDVAAIEVYATQ